MYLYEKSAHSSYQHNFCKHVAASDFSQLVGRTENSAGTLRQDETFLEVALVASGRFDHVTRHGTTAPTSASSLRRERASVLEDAGVGDRVAAWLLFSGFLHIRNFFFNLLQDRLALCDEELRIWLDIRCEVLTTHVHVKFLQLAKSDHTIICFRLPLSHRHHKKNSNFAPKILGCKGQVIRCRSGKGDMSVEVVTHQWGMTLPRGGTSDFVGGRGHTERGLKLFMLRPKQGLFQLYSRRFANGSE